MSNLTDYLLDLAADPGRCKRFKADPESELRHADISDSEKAAAATRDPQKIAAAIADLNPEPQMVLQWLLSVSQGADD